jgi:tetratricopeptide (TPR) repeat protein
MFQLISTFVTIVKIIRRFIKEKMSLRRTLFLAVIFALSLVEAAAQKPSHVERFSSPQILAKQTENRATAKLEKNASDAESLNERAVARIHLGRFAEAAEDLRRAINANPNNAEYQANYGYVLAKLGKIEEAVKTERAALKLDDKNFTAHYQLGRFLLKIGGENNIDEALVHLRRALELKPVQDEIRFDLISIYRLKNDFANASAQLAILENARMTDARVPYLRALLLTDRGDLKEAIPNFQDALRKNENLTIAWRDLGVTHLKLKNWSEAAAVFTELSKKDQNSVEAAYFKALSLYNLGKIGEAETEARRALEINAGFSEAQTLLGIILASRGSANNEAKEALEQAVALDAKNFDGFFYLGRVRYALKDYASAIESLKKAVDLQPKHAEARFFLGTALEDAGDSESALTQYQELVKFDQNSVYGQLGLGALLVKQGKLEEAIAALRRANEIDATNFEARWALGRAFMLTERFAEAAESLKKAVELQPLRSDAHYQLGLAYRRLGKTVEAAKEFEIVNRLNKEFRTTAAP